MQNAAATSTSVAKRAGIASAITALVAGILMVVLGDAAYLWIKAIHVVAIVSWMAGLLYLPRLFIYHCEAAPNSVQSETFKIMEQRLLLIIMTPAMAIAWVLGLWLAWRGGHFSAPWLHGKLAAVIALTAVHAYFAVSVRRFAADANMKPARHWRLVNEAPTILMVVIVVLVIVKPF